MKKLMTVGLLAILLSACGVVRGKIEDPEKLMDSTTTTVDSSENVSSGGNESVSGDNSDSNPDELSEFCRDYAETFNTWQDQVNAWNAEFDADLHRRADAVAPEPDDALYQEIREGADRASEECGWFELPQLPYVDIPNF